MPRREELFVNGKIYHVFNKTLDHRQIFIHEVCDTFLQILTYYRSQRSTRSFSLVKSLDEDDQTKILKEIFIKKYFQIEIFVYCLMPTHFHLLVYQKQNNGILKCISNTLNSFTRYYNLKNERKGPLFLPRFKSVLIRNEEQLKHVSRYIHLNPYSNGLVNSFTELLSYRYSSLKSYIDNFDNKICSTDYILNIFNNNHERYKKFVEDNADYQKSLEEIKYIKNW